MQMITSKGFIPPVKKYVFCNDFRNVTCPLFRTHESRQNVLNSRQHMVQRETDFLQFIHLNGATSEI